MQLSAIVALGNPGLRYAATRHNAGVWLLESLMSGKGLNLKKHKSIAAEYAKSDDLLFLRSTDYMNNSGLGVAALLRYYKIPNEQVLVLHDELDLPAGTVRLKKAGGNGGHNGLKSLISHMQGQDFWRMRIGIGRPNQQQDVSSYVLGIPGLNEVLQIRAALKAVAENFNYIEQGDAQAFMRVLHSLES